MDAALYIARLLFAALLLTIVMKRSVAYVVFHAMGERHRMPNPAMTFVATYLLLAILVTFVNR